MNLNYENTRSKRCSTVTQNGNKKAEKSQHKSDAATDNVALRITNAQQTRL